MNKSQEKQLKLDLESGCLMRATERNLSHDEEEKIFEICAKISSQESSDMDENVVTEEDISTFSAGAKYILNQEVCRRFPHLSASTYHQDDKVCKFVIQGVP
jgi:hypothetical protein